ncbi:hypothetical protein, partial [Providencia rustigianii]|uniref:hypothetical protein n=1 Tax=Providencia rustigianii TaxID=158850 RepID=UPI0022403602
MDKYNKEQMKLGVLFARNHLISAYRANFIDCDLKEFAKFMSLLSHVANESIDIELMMSDVLACNEQAEEWIKSALENSSGHDYLAIEIGVGDKVFSTVDIENDSKVGLVISPRKDYKRDIGVKFDYPDGTDIQDLEPLVLITTNNVK